jgi:hypothetical protein
MTPVIQPPKGCSPPGPENETLVVVTELIELFSWKQSADWWAQIQVVTFTISKVAITFQ